MIFYGYANRRSVRIAFEFIDDLWRININVVTTPKGKQGKLLRRRSGTFWDRPKHMNV